MATVILGAGFVGLATLHGLAARGRTDLWLVDGDIDVIVTLRAGELPPSLALEHWLKPALGITALLNARIPGQDVALEKLAADGATLFICVDAPLKGGVLDGSKVEAAVRWWRSHGHGLIIIRSTVQPGFTARLGREIGNVVHYPEFFAEGTGGRVSRSSDVFGVVPGTHVDSLYPLADGASIVTSTESELLKLATNAWLAHRLWFVQNVAQVAMKCEEPADGIRVLDLLQNDFRYGHGYSTPGVWGGSCLPKDTTAFDRMVDSASVFDGNFKAMRYVMDRIADAIMGGSRSLLIVGAGFKAGSTDVRNSWAVSLLTTLDECLAGDEAQSGGGEITIRLHDIHREAVEQVDAAVDHQTWLFTSSGTDPFEAGWPAVDTVVVLQESVGLQIGHAVKAGVKVWIDGRGGLHPSKFDGTEIVYYGFGRPQPR